GPSGGDRRRSVRPRRPVQLVRATAPPRALEGRPRSREGGRLPGPLPRARARVSAPRPRHALHDGALLPEPGARGVVRRALEPPSPPLPGARPRAPAARSRGGHGGRRRVLRAGLAARNGAKLKVRQPLGRMLLAAPPSVERGVRAFEAEILDELNVERLE